MTTTPDAPADTAMMRIVHAALRRDLGRAHATLGRPVPPAQRRAVGRHLIWMMGFLHAHHAVEDDGLYPLVRRRAVDRADLAVLDRMARDHEAIAPAMASVEAAAGALASDPTDDATEGTVDALASLAEVLLPHLQTEEDEAMPLASRLVTAAEWDAIEQEHSLDGKTTAELGFEGHWLIDGTADADRATVVGLVPPVQRFVLLHGFAGRYRRHVARCWATATARPRRVQMENEVDVVVAADIEDVWDVVRDPTRVGEWSHECIGAQWIGGATAPAPGSRFRGRNRAGVFRWGRVCEVVSAEPYELVWRTVPTRRYPDSSEWRIALDRVDGGGTRISQGFHVVRAPKVLSVVYALLIPDHRDRTDALREDLERLGAVARRPHVAAA